MSAPATAKLIVLRVFTDERGRWGNHVGVFLEPDRVPSRWRHAVAADLGYSETVFVDNPLTGEVRLFGPAGELPFAGHPLVGVASLLMDRQPGLNTLHPPGGPVDCWREGDAVWIRASTHAAPTWKHLGLSRARAVDELSGPPPGYSLVQTWAWIDEAEGSVRARTFAPGLEVAEDEACGSASMLLCERLGRPLTISHGRGSVISVRPGPGNTIELGGRVARDDDRVYYLPLRAASGQIRSRHDT